MWVHARDAGGQFHRTGKTPHREETVLAWQNRFTSSSAPASMLRQPVTCGNTQSLLRAAELGERECNGRPTRGVRMTHGRPARKPRKEKGSGGWVQEKTRPPRGALGARRRAEEEATEPWLCGCLPATRVDNFTAQGRHHTGKRRFWRGCSDSRLGWLVLSGR